MLSQKLDKRSLTDWEISLGNNSEVPSYRQLDEFLAARIRSLEAVRMTVDTRPSTSQSSSTSKRRIQLGSHHASSSSSGKCVCGLEHPLYLCRSFKELPVEKRKEFARQQSRCYNCLRVGHLPNACTSMFTCRFCHKRHHSLLHGERSGGSSRAATSAGTSQKDNDISGTTSATAPTEVSSITVNNTNCNLDTRVTKSYVFLATATVFVTSSEGRRAKVRALLDQGSEATFVSESLVQLLGARRESTSTGVSGIGGTYIGTSRSRVQLQLTSTTSEESSVYISALVLPKLSSYAPPSSVDWTQWPHLRGLLFADQGSPADRVEIIIGADYFGSILREGLRRGSMDAPVAQLTLFGWVVSGSCNPTKDTKSSVSVAHCTTPSLTTKSNDELFSLVRRFWELEEIPRSHILSDAEKRCEEHFILTHSRASNGRYIVRLPFKDDTPPDLGESQSKALLMLSKIHHTFSRKPEVSTEYRAFMREYESLGHMRPLIDPNTSSIPRPVYLPHHSVFRQDSQTTKIRVVFNASSKTTNGTTLNDHLLIGPRLQADLTSIISSWRKFQYVFKADLQKMFRQILVHNDDLDFQRVVWSESSSIPPTHYQLLTVTYGTASAPFLANRVLLQLAKDEGARFPIAEQIVRQCFYVDDVFFGDHEKDRLILARRQLINLMQCGGFSLHKWSSNDDSLFDSAIDTKVSVSLSDATDSIEKVLGLHWNSREDCFHFSFESPKECPRTKREVLSLIARIFDPLGWIAPVVVTAKILIQDLWLHGSNWDEIIPDGLKSAWEPFFEALPSIRDVRVPRWLNIGEETPVEIHGFADASNRAIAAVVYLRSVHELDAPYVSLIISKTRVAPIKTVSIPRLELCAVVLLARLLRKVQTELEMTQAPIYAWTDSSVVLAWLGKHPIHWKPFVANRVAEVHDLVPNINWKHVPSAQNPADCATRGLSPPELLRLRQWWHGPEWLSRHSTKWPTSPVPQGEEGSGFILEERRHESIKTHLITWENSPFKLPWIVSSWPRLIRITALLYEFIARARSLNRESCLAWKPDLLRRARSFWYRCLQRDAFDLDIKALSRNSRLSSSSKLIKLDPFLDDLGLLRVGGRLRHSSLPYDQKHPLILPQHRITELIVQQVHSRTLHGGTQLMLAVLRQEFWILNARRLVKQVIHQCHVCVRQRAQLSSQFMGDLPSPRVTPSSPFSYCGVDYAGPLMVRAMTGRGHRAYKSYIALFVCLSTRAIHLELVSDYSTSGFIAALKRFVSRRGRPVEILSDNGTNFRGADNELRKTVATLSHADEVIHCPDLEGIRWKFIPPGAPHFGGLWEAGVRNTKFHIKRVVGESTLTFEEMTTLLCLVEACLNSRPLSALSDDPNDLEFLTPGHFLIGRPLVGLAEQSVAKDNPSLLTRWQLVTRMNQHFWRRWSNEYLHSLQQRPRWLKRNHEFSVGSLVLVRSATAPPSRWTMGRIVETHPGDDGLVRVVKLRTARGLLTRPITQLCLLPAASSKSTPISPPDPPHSASL